MNREQPKLFPHELGGSLPAVSAKVAPVSSQISTVAASVFAIFPQIPAVTP